MPASTPADTGPRQSYGLPARYPLVRPVGRGGMASVWCAHDRVLDRKVAIKLMADGYLRSPAAAKRFRREARAAARLSSHPSVVTIFDIGQTDPTDAEPNRRPFIVMEYLHGGTVSDALRVGAVDRRRALRWIAEAGAALDYAHEHGVVHRDIKPANLLLDGNSRLHVGDFGIALVAAEETANSAQELFGTAAYLSPEQALGHAATAASDRYSLAVVAFELLVGERPFLSPQFLAQARQHIEDPPPKPSDRDPELPPAVDEVLLRGLAKAPEERWESGRAFADALAGVLDPPGAGVPPTPAITTPRAPASQFSGAPSAHEPARGQRARRAPAIAALCLGAVAAAAVAAGTGLDHPHASSAATGLGPARMAGAVASGESAHAQAQQLRANRVASGLEARGQALLSAGDASAAVPVLRSAVRAASPSSQIYAYALFDLGRALRLAGDPQEAIGVLTRRLAIPTQTGAVREELTLAIEAAQDQSSASEGAASSSTTAGPPENVAPPGNGGAAPVPRPKRGSAGSGSGNHPHPQPPGHADHPAPSHPQPTGGAREWPAHGHH